MGALHSPLSLNYSHLGSPNWMLRVFTKVSTSWLELTLSFTSLQTLDLLCLVQSPQELFSARFHKVLILTQLSVQLNNQKDSCTDFWNSYSVQLPPSWYFVPQISIASLFLNFNLSFLHSVRLLFSILLPQICVLFWKVSAGKKQERMLSWLCFLISS